MLDKTFLAPPVPTPRNKMASEGGEGLLSITTSNATAQDIINKLQLLPHPEGGFYRETYRSESKNSDGESHGTAIYYIMSKSDGLVWHRIRGKNELWHFYAGDPAEVLTAAPDGVLQKKTIFGPDIFQDQEPQFLIRADYWQMARCLGEWTLFGCTVSPGFEFADFEMAPKGWQPTEQNK
ncbi:uncharacterized protein LOC119729232 isoform X4 [Patiria miniata]|uniref:DUF985 domain-containing protein n=1 Tax=Patiria miniata TaxID=46514 RepID=A0A914A1N6_PATMI|nr:uncharacterized protein LOC119729232 isoform X4 [Patiria miniata]